MKPKNILPKGIHELEAVKYIAFRYGTTPELVLEHYLVQCGMITAGEGQEAKYTLAPNEVALFHDLGIRPAMVEKK